MFDLNINYRMVGRDCEIVTVEKPENVLTVKWIHAGDVIGSQYTLRAFTRYVYVGAILIGRCTMHLVSTVDDTAADDDIVLRAAAFKHLLATLDHGVQAEDKL